MLRLIVSTQGAGEERQLQTFDANLPEVEDWLSKLNGSRATLKVEKLEVVPGKAKKARPPKPKRVAPVPCPYEKVIAAYIDEFVDWAPPPGSQEKAANLDSVEWRLNGRKTKIWLQRREMMDELWCFILLDRLPEVHDDGHSRPYTEEEGLQWLHAYCRRARRIKWMMHGSPGRDWRANFDYIFTERARQKVIEMNDAHR